MAQFSKGDPNLSVAIVALTFSKYIAKPFFPECDPPDDAVRILAAMCICKSGVNFKYYLVMGYIKMFDLMCKLSMKN